MGDHINKDRLIVVDMGHKSTERLRYRSAGKQTV